MCQIQIGFWCEKERRFPPAPPRMGNGPPWTIPVPAELLAQQFLEAQAPLNYDLAPVEQDNELGRLEVLVSTLLNATVIGQVAGELLDPATKAQINGQLALVPNDRSLFEVAENDNDIWAALEQLFTSFLAVNGVGPAIATKILHKKRPRLIPPVDSRTLEGYRYGYELAYPINPQGLVQVVQNIRADIVANLDALNAVRAAVPGLDGITIVRVFDMILWQFQNQVAAPAGEDEQAVPPQPQDTPPTPNGEGDDQYPSLEKSA